ncbi:drug/metabolite transporter (DMT)-like permease [Rhizomicrobium palustre]|uniref:Drug/metabolite transporter (DMT)-like permease n=1 Tax=Rhizomicrobium palustre TaxID=189966 RepID=A0A846MX96_9PROT|nr:hypothetical protein [Rhizomicrobium palustre]NIK87640.1 drug/metabolite transporter (DMT)-like permease [Rhizomicrobium palustre]
MLGFFVASLIVFAGLSFILSRDDGRFGTAIRLGEILIPLAAAMFLGAVFLKGWGRNYFLASCFFGIATALALLRKTPSFWHSRPPEGERVFTYGAMLLIGGAITAVTYFGHGLFW